MKRSRNVRQLQQAKARFPKLKYTARFGALAAGASLLTGCGGEDAYIYKTVAECSYDNPGYNDNCEYAYRRALAEWDQTAPRYNSQGDCEYDFGYQECRERRPYFIPIMAGFMMAENNLTEEEFDLDFDRPKPLGSSKRRGSTGYGKWIGAQGGLYGDFYSSKTKVKRSIFSAPKSTGRVTSRGGFGRTISSRSSGG